MQEETKLGHAFINPISAFSSGKKQTNTQEQQQKTNDYLSQLTYYTDS